MRSLGIALVVASAGIAALSGCKKRSADEQAKARIFSSDQAGTSQPEAKEPIDASRLADDPKLAGRVLRMSQSEVAARLGPHRAETRVQFAWFRGPGLPDGGSDVALSEQSAPSWVSGSTGFGTWIRWSPSWFKKLRRSLGIVRYFHRIEI